MTTLHASIRHGDLPSEAQVPEPLRAHIQIDRAADSWRFRSDGDLSLEDTFREWLSDFETVLTLGNAFNVRTCLRILGQPNKSGGNRFGDLAEAVDRDGGADIDPGASLLFGLYLMSRGIRARPVTALVDLRREHRFAGWPQGHTVHDSSTCKVVAGTHSLRLHIPGRTEPIFVDGWKVVGDDTLSAHTPEGREETLSDSIARTLSWLARGSSHVQVECGNLDAVFEYELGALETAFRVANTHQTGLRVYSRGAHLPAWWNEPPDPL